MNRQRGQTIFELTVAMVFAVALIGVVTQIGLFARTDDVRVTESAEELRRARSLLEKLEREIRAASAVRSIDGELHITHPAGTTVWRQTLGNARVRVTQSERRVTATLHWKTTYGTERTLRSTVRMRGGEPR